MAKTLLQLTEKEAVDLTSIKEQVAAELGCAPENIRDDKAMALAEAMGVEGMPQPSVVNVVQYETVKTKKLGVYAVVDVVKGFGRDAGKVFFRLGNPDDKLDVDAVKTLATLATDLEQRAKDARAIADRALALLNS